MYILRFHYWLHKCIIRLKTYVVATTAAFFPLLNVFLGILVPLFDRSSLEKTGNLRGETRSVGAKPESNSRYCSYVACALTIQLSEHSVFLLLPCMFAKFSNSFNVGKLKLLLQLDLT